MTAAGVPRRSVSLVLTHSPTGNERRHPQHVQSWQAVSRWARIRRLPVGFFAEGSLPQIQPAANRALWPGAEIADVRPSLREVRKAIADVAGVLPARRRGLRTKATTLRRWVDTFAWIRTVVGFDVDRAKKLRLLELYPSQVDGMRQYESYATEREFLYLLRGGRDALCKEAQWPS